MIFQIEIYTYVLIRMRSCFTRNAGGEEEEIVKTVRILIFLNYNKI